MTRNVKEQVKEYGRKHRFRSRWAKLLCAMACVVVFCTTYALILPAITLENSATCGMEEHSHGVDCYEQVLICTDESEEHVHSADCYEDRLICSIPEHTHSEECYAQETEDADQTDAAALPLTEQTVNADVYTDATYTTLSDNPATITLKGLLPEGVAVRAYPVDVTLDNENATVVEAYDISLFVTVTDETTGEKTEEEYEPDDKVEVKILSEKLKGMDSVNVYHIDDADESNPEPKPELVKEGAYVGEDNEVKFDAERFSTYALTTGEDGIDALANSTESLTMKVGETKTLTGRNYYASHTGWSSSYNSQSYNTDVATLSVSNYSATITAVGTGTATVRVYYSTSGYLGTINYNNYIDYTVTVTAANGPYTVTYVVDSAKENISSNYSAGSQEWNGRVSVKDLNGLSESVGSATETSVSYTVRDVSSQTWVSKATYGTKGEMLFTYTFLYWEGSDGNRYQPGVTIEKLSGDITLTAKWCAHFDGNLTTTDHSNNTKWNSAAFYIAISSDVSGSATATNNYTDALYTTRINGDAAKTAAGTDDTKLYGSDDRTNYKEHDKTIRENANIFTEFPSDETIFSRIRTWAERADRNTKTTITVNKKDYEASEITADNFDIYWFVVKSNTGDTWHVDGLLKLKEASLTVTKTFVGSNEAIVAAQNDYNITVSESGGTTSDDTTSYNLSLNEGNNPKNVTLYHEEGSNTYTWVLTGLKQLTQYNVKENNYHATEYNVAPSYQITNSRTSSENTDGWVSYPEDDGVTVEKCYGYQSNVDYTAYQTVSLRNVYTKPFVMTILKQDGTTYNGLKNVEFELTVEDSEGETNTQKVTTNLDGQIEVNFQNLGGAGTYTFTLKEQPYEGYQALATINGTAKVDENGVVTVSDVTGVVTGENTLVSADRADSSIVYIQNISKRTSVTVKKVWTDGTDKQVTMQLVRNGADVTGETATLNKDNLNKDNDWTHTWSDLPLYVDGEKAVYTVRETWIGKPGASGSSSYTAADDADGYKDYIVTTSSVQSEDGSTTITVTNTKDNGQVVFTKVDENNNSLAGATFTVFTDADCKNVAKIGDADAVFTSDSNGLVTIVGLPAGTYYVKETTAPDGYVLDKTVYTLNAKEHNSTLTRGGNIVSNVRNEKSRMNLTIAKVDAASGNKGNWVYLDGAEFTLTNEDGEYYNGADADGNAQWSVTKSTFTTGADGIGGMSLIERLSDGEYVLTEIKAPDGYNLLTDSLTITISGGKITSVKYTKSMVPLNESLWSNDNKDVDVDGSDGEDGGSNVTVTEGAYIYIENTAGAALPDTGGMGTSMYTTGGLVLMAVAIALCLMYSGRKHRRA